MSLELKKLIESSTLSFATVGKDASPHIIYVAFARVDGDNLVITNNYMRSTVKNIESNPKVAVSFFTTDGKGFELLGTASVQKSGKYFDLIKTIPENKGLPAKSAIVVSVSKINKML